MSVVAGVIGGRAALSIPEIDHSGRSRAEIGERIILAAPELIPAAPLVRASHERFDGRGYPDGLRGEEIPLGGSIIAVCDAFLVPLAG